jgi:energy-coupling factor transport system substrate-specific component
VFAAFLYGSYRLYVALLAGASAGLFLAVNDLIVWYPGSTPAFAAIYTVSSIVSGIVLAGLLSALAVKGLAKTGALNRFASGRGSGVRV